MLFIVALRLIGTARAGAYFSIAPFFGAILAIALGDPITIPLIDAGALMVLGVWPHRHVEFTHTHAHEHYAEATTGTRTRRHSAAVGREQDRPMPGEWSLGRAPVVVQPQRDPETAAPAHVSGGAVQRVDSASGQSPPSAGAPDGRVSVHVRHSLR